MIIKKTLKWSIWFKYWGKKRKKRKKEVPENFDNFENTENILPINEKKMYKT